jgi:hypothetical protein
MTWEYRVVKKIDRFGRISYSIHEVYYEDDTIVTITETPSLPIGESEEELLLDLNLMLRALKKPTIVYDDI